MSYIVRKASEEDALQVQHFIAKVGVAKQPATTDWSSYLVAEDEQGQFVAVVRIQEVTKTIGLIRTLVVDSEKITSIFILEFLEATLHYAENAGIKDIYLLAANEAGFLKQLGFTKTLVNELPKELVVMSDVQAHQEKQLPILKKTEAVNN
ncbi:GNAT family N-acetyltransferase [Evansella cellulosilytica]|uniref:N-acetyltransferase domain-containing protein n=1 Tax=Evansella cellulosilytica (strain ATCC 21833 / DSM 2522 / FERM P-1141 / JCM 9156 / N-4) TaxID=649639 RepID=E6TXC4_EVAC2|nr:hypothetical protein [Evansella cellulosilytica]ADU32319.1 hypothetical protein Bcell_4089 [Evansella cellulosilytica DSM 2522]